MQGRGQALGVDVGPIHSRLFAVEGREVGGKVQERAQDEVTVTVTIAVTC